jgi:hypothetical protein
MYYGRVTRDMINQILERRTTEHSSKTLRSTTSIAAIPCSRPFGGVSLKADNKHLKRSAVIGLQHVHNQPNEEEGAIGFLTQNEEKQLAELKHFKNITTASSKSHNLLTLWVHRTSKSLLQDKVQNYYTSGS